ncbi:nuclear transport factor 2 family protein [Scytonema sp. NUACC21]
MSQNAELIRELYKSIARGDQQTNRALTDPNFEWHLAKYYPYGGPFIGHDAVFYEFFSRLLNDFDDWSVQPDELLDVGDTVVSLGHYRGLAKATGIKVDAPFAHIWRLKDDKVMHMQQYTDTYMFVEAVGRTSYP